VREETPTVLAKVRNAEVALIHGKGVVGTTIRAERIEFCELAVSKPLAVIQGEEIKEDRKFRFGTVLGRRAAFSSKLAREFEEIAKEVLELKQTITRRRRGM